MPDGQVVFEISGDNRNVKQVLSDTTSAIEKEGKKWDKAADDSARTMEDKITAAFKAITASAVAMKVGKALLDFGKDAIQAASDLEEVQNVVDVTFGEGAAQIEKWAKAAGQQFGLTETQAKKFTSTLGAMMKSAGLAGPEIVNMSTDLAGLAADMASFYNLDFDTAFQKIRSGISGETEPLKQLGINMSVANLEAYALSKGISTAFDKMSQGEQTMLRYQYLMQATADAQGDFARTSDGYANSLRQLETNIEQLKTNVGNILLPIVNNVVSGINDMMAALTQTKPRTVLDEFADIDLKTEEKLAEIQKTADEADALIGVLEDIAGKKIQSTSLTNFVSSLTGQIDGLDRAMEKAKQGDYAGTVEGIATAMSQATGTSAKAWDTLLTAIGEKLPQAYNALLDDKGQTEAFLAAAAAAADDLGGEYPQLWQQMLQVLGDNAGDAIRALADGKTSADALEALANGVNALSPSVDVDKWGRLLTALSGSGKIDLTGAGRSIEEFAEALNGTDPSTDRATAWQELLGALSADVEGLSQLTGTSAEETSEWLSTLAEGANALDPNKADGWAELFGSLVSGLPGLNNGKNGELFSDLFSGVDDSEAYLRALGYETDDIVDKQSAWLETCRQLVKTIPGLNSIINTETGEVKGGVQAIKDYVDAWEKAQADIVRAEALKNMQDALQNALTNQLEIQTNITFDTAMLDQYQRHLDEIRKKYDLGENATAKQMSAALWASGYGDVAEEVELCASEINRLDAEIRASNNSLDDAQRETEYARQKLDIATEAAKELGIGVEDAADSTGNLATELTELEKAANGDEAAFTSLADALNTTTAALEEVEKYYQNVKDATDRSISSVVSGFGEIETPAEKARREFRELNQELADLSDQDIDIRITGESTIPTIQNMTKGLEDQLAYLKQYQDDMEKAQALGVSGDLLATLSDGSVESADYLHALANASEEEIKALNEQWAAVQEQKEALSAALTDTQLDADAEFQALVDAAQAAAEGLNVYSITESAMESTVQGIADGIAAKIDTVQTQVDALNAVLGNIGNIGGATGAWLGSLFHLDGSHAMGLDYVPFDNYLAQLHEGESVLTAEEAKVWRDFKYGGTSVANTIDYDAMGGVMRENIKPGGNVYLNGRVVGQVLSEEQGNSLRALQRSGWQG